MPDADAVFQRFHGHETDADTQDRLWQELGRTVLADTDVPFHEHWALYQSVFADRPAEAGPPKAWSPDDATIRDANLTSFMEAVEQPDYAALHNWSVQERAAFWQAALGRLAVPYHQAPGRILDEGEGPEDPRWLPGARMNVASLCRQADGGRPAIIAGGEGHDSVQTWTYTDLWQLADKVSRGLGRLGLVPGDALALYLPMTPECVAAYLGIVQAGLVVVSIPDSFAPAEVATRLRLGDAKAILTVDAFTRGGKEVAMAPKARDAAAQAGGVRLIVIGEADDGEVTWKDLLGDGVGGGSPFEAVVCDPYDATNILFSSGTTGEPKAIPWTHLTPLKAAVDGHFHQDIHPEDVVAWPTNIGWMMGPWLIYATFANHATMALWQGAPTGDAFLDFMDEAGVTVLGLVPAIARSWFQAGVRPHRLPKVRVWSSTGEASNAHDYLYLMSLAGYRAPVIEYCGGTEIGGGHITGTVLQPQSPATFSTPALGLDFVVLDGDGAPVAPGGHGELFLIPPSIGLSQRLLNRDHHQVYYEGCPPGLDGQVLRRHGDEVHVLPGGFWAAGGRADDTMNLGGIKVSSIELESAMNGHPGVVEAAAVAVQGGGGGADQLVVFVVPTDDGGDAAALHPGLQQRIRERLNPLFRVHDVVVVDALPRTASNKVMRRELRAAYTGKD